MKKALAFMIALSMSAAMSGCGALFLLASLGSDSSEATESTTVETTEESTTVETTEETTQETTEKITKETEISMEFGEIESVIYNNIDGKSVAVVKAKITPSYSNEATINQNYFNVEDLIVNQGFDKYDEIQYWAVADMTNGSESKVISFTVDAEVIDLLKNKKIPANMLGDYLDDLWVLPSLNQKENLNSESASSSDSVCSLLQIALNSSYKDSSSVEYQKDSKTYVISLWKDGIALGLSTINTNETARNAWENLKQSMIALSSSAQETVKNVQPDAHVTVMVLNDNDHTKTLLTVLDGVIIYDAADDIIDDN